VSVLTTKKDVFNESEEGEVPQRDLLEGLQELGPVHSTDELDTDVWWMDLAAPASGNHTFAFAAGPAMPH
jgi:hypothetical protein